jgi:hypothetical protein
MSMFSRIVTTGCLATLLCAGSVLLNAQEPATASKPTDRLSGEITAVDATAKTITVKDDATKAPVVVNLGAVRTVLRVPPGEKDPKKFEKISFSDLGTGDRVVLRGRKGEGEGKPFEASTALQMTAGDLADKRQAEIADWQKRGSSGTLVSVDANAKTALMTGRSADGPKQITLQLPDSVQFIRYSPASVKYADAKPSSITALRAGDQVRVLGAKSEDGQSIAVERMISGAFRTVPATIVSISPDSKEMKITDLRTKRPVMVTLTDESNVRRLPAAVAQMLVVRVNPQAAAATGESGSSANRPPTASGAPGPSGRATGGQGGGGRGNGDLTQMVERLPKIPASELKAGDAVVVSGGSEDDGKLTAINIIAGVEPLFVSAPPRSGQNAAGLGSWNLDISNIGGPGGLQ